MPSYRVCTSVIRSAKGASRARAISRALGIAVQPDQPQARQFGQEPLRVPARAEGGIDEHGARSVGVRGGSAPG